LSADIALPKIIDEVRRYWGYGQLRPLQEEAIRAGLEQQDSLVVLPTGGGKSLCYQVPPLLSGRTDIVISPLISLMKDQVDGLQGNGYPAAALHSAMSASQRRDAEAFIASGRCRLIFMAPERLFTPWFAGISQRMPIGAFAIDEAHCISHWGHDFRPEYRRLAILKQRFPGASLHAYTATATERVRQDIIDQLQLRDPKVLVGWFDRPNLIYRIIYRQNLKKQVEEVLDRHRGEAVIIYCISRDDTERLAASLTAKNIQAAYYHAGMPAEERRKTQEAFINEACDVIVATVAFGMGIDRSDVRCVIHAAMPQSIEHYQQETGRAGRDGLEAECVLLYSPADVLRWRSLFERGSEEEAYGETAENPGLELLNHMRSFSAPGRCRHRMLTEYFGQSYPKESCKACDVCLEEVEDLVNGTTQAQMILSCVVRTGQRFGAAHIVDVLRGAETARIKSLRHDELSTFGLMKDVSKTNLLSLVYQLVDQDLVGRTVGQYPTLYLTPEAGAVLKGGRQVWLLPMKKKKVKRTAIEQESWAGVDRALFDRLRGLRSRLARERGVPPYVVFNDATLRDMARQIPRTSDAMLAVHGIGEKKLADYGEIFLQEMEAYRDGLP